MINGFKEGGIVQALENGMVGPLQSGTLLDDYQADDPFLDMHDDAD